jgi:hypothetical protein
MLAVWRDCLRAMTRQFFEIADDEFKSIRLSEI